MFRYPPPPQPLFRDGERRDHDLKLGLEERFKELQKQLDRMTLINMTLWSFIQEQHGLSDKQLATRMREIDLMDGSLDGRFRKGVTLCIECGRTIAAKPRCMYCGAEQPPDTPFDAVP